MNGAPVATSRSSTPRRRSEAMPSAWKKCVEGVSLGNRARSTTATRKPLRASWVASGDPAHLAPTMATSKCSVTGTPAAVAASRLSQLLREEDSQQPASCVLPLYVPAFYTAPYSIPSCTVAQVTRTLRTEWIDEGLRALAAGGPDAVRIEALARALGVTKGGFYWHFNGRPALLDEMLDAWERAVIDEVERRVDSEGGDARSRLKRLFALAGSSRDLLKIEMAIREWARRDKSVAKRLRRIDSRRMEYVRALFAQFCADADEVEVRCLLSMALFVGGPLITVDFERRSRSEVLQLAAERLLS